MISQRAISVVMISKRAIYVVMISKRAIAGHDIKEGNIHVHYT